ncbi:hypothetical protein D3C73_1073600 [compost metagenome]
MRLRKVAVLVQQQAMKDIQRQLGFVWFALAGVLRSLRRAVHAHQGIAQAALDQVQGALVDPEDVAQKTRMNPRVTLQCTGQQVACFIVATAGNHVHRHRIGQHDV